jgi:hypothetical protein
MNWRTNASAGCYTISMQRAARAPDSSRFRLGNLEYEVHEGVGMLFDRTALERYHAAKPNDSHFDGRGRPLVEVVHMAA